MKKLLTILTLIICIYANAQQPEVKIVLPDKVSNLSSDKINESESHSDEIKKAWRKSVDIEILILKAEITSLKKEVADLKRETNLSELALALGAKVFTPDELPKDLKADELGIAFIKDETDQLSLAAFINNEWKILRL